MVLLRLVLVENRFQGARFRRQVVLVDLQNGLLEITLGITRVVLEGRCPIAHGRFRAGIGIRSRCEYRFRCTFHRTRDAQRHPGEIHGGSGQQTRLCSGGSVRQTTQFQEVVSHVTEDRIDGLSDTLCGGRYSTSPAVDRKSAHFAFRLLPLFTVLRGKSCQARPHKLEQKVMGCWGLEEREVQGIAHPSFHPFDLSNTVEVIRHVGDVLCLGSRCFLHLAGQPNARRTQQLESIPWNKIATGALGLVVFAFVRAAFVPVLIIVAIV
mmetsp:Transcript_1065/g.2369  ORF Transcript_1065/g.2369 Transcript_1065/m.2369 type:complete len:267 (+) Transcript_1065:1663-2463(+)